MTDLPTIEDVAKLAAASVTAGERANRTISYSNATETAAYAHAAESLSIAAVNLDALLRSVR